jgi:hypothetical protein
MPTLLHAAKKIFAMKLRFLDYEAMAGEHIFFLSST